MIAGIGTQWVFKKRCATWKPFGRKIDKNAVINKLGMLTLSLKNLKTCFVNKSNYSFSYEKIIFHTKNLQKSIEKAFTMQFDSNNYNKIQNLMFLLL